jgi:hypothetical protein
VIRSENKSPYEERRDTFMFTVVVIMLPICLVTMLGEFLMSLPEKARERKAVAFLRSKYGTFTR